MILRRRRLALTKEVEKPASSFLRPYNGESISSRIQALYPHSILQTCPVCRMNRPESYRHERHIRRQGHSGASSKHWQDTHAMPRPPNPDTSASAIIVVPSERLQAAMQTDEKRGPSASQCASLANSIQPAWRQDTHAASLLAARLRAGPLSCVACFQVPRGGPRMGFRFGIACATRVRPCLSLQYVKGSVRWRSEGGTYVVGLGGRLVGGLGFFLWDCTLLYIHAHLYRLLPYQEITAGYKPLAPHPYSPRANPSTQPRLPTASRSPNKAKAKPNKHRHSSTATQPHLTSHLPPQPPSCPAPT